MHRPTHIHSPSIANSTPKHNLLRIIAFIVFIWFEFWCWVQNLCKFFCFFGYSEHTAWQHHTFYVRTLTHSLSLSNSSNRFKKWYKLKSTLYIFFSHLILFLSQNNIYLLTQNIGKMDDRQDIWQLFEILPKYTKFNQKRK